MSRKSKAQRHVDEMQKTISDIIYGQPDEAYIEEKYKMSEGIADYLEKMSKIGGADNEDRELAAKAAWYVRSLENTVKKFEKDIERLQEEVQILSSIENFREKWGQPLKDLLRASTRGEER